MVHVVKKAPILKILRGIYDKSFWEKARILWASFQNTNPTLAFFGPIGAATGLTLFVIVNYLKRTRSGIPKYYDHIVVYRPDDPRVELIRKDECYRYQTQKFTHTIEMVE